MCGFPSVCVCVCVCSFSCVLAVEVLMKGFRSRCGCVSHPKWRFIKCGLLPNENLHFTARDHSTGCKTLQLIPFWEPLCLVFETKEQHKKQKAASASSRLAEYAHKPDHHVIMDVMLEGNTAGFQMTQAT